VEARLRVRLRYFPRLFGALHRIGQCDPYVNRAVPYTFDNVLYSTTYKKVSITLPPNDQRSQLDIYETYPNKERSANDLSVSVVLVEAFAGLLAEPAGVDHALEQDGGTVLRVARALV
jgi:hypothetical protein